VLAKIASQWQKPSGLTVIPGRDIHRYLQELPIGKVWGIGEQTTALLKKYGIGTALAFVRMPEQWVQHHLTKPFSLIWQELRGQAVLPVETHAKTSYQSIQKVKTFTPPSTDPTFVFAQLSKNIENACSKARKYRLAAKGALLFLKTQQFLTHGVEVHFSRPTAFPQEILKVIGPAFETLFVPRTQYRTTGVVLLKLDVDTITQLDLFGEVFRLEKLSRVYNAVDHLRKKYGKHTVFLGTSLPAHRFAQHVGERGDEPQRRRQLFKGETKRQRLGIPMLMGKLLE
jgi:nucleotidyltransferase/DNA polymerase involved in DNA repair